MHSITLVITDVLKTMFHRAYYIRTCIRRYIHLILWCLSVACVYVCMYTCMYECISLCKTIIAKAKKESVYIAIQECCFSTHSLIYLEIFSSRVLLWVYSLNMTHTYNVLYMHLPYLATYDNVWPNLCNCIYCAYLNPIYIISTIHAHTCRQSTINKLTS